jgi:hypothetical protein
MNVYTKLNAARKSFHKLQLKKTGLNSFAKYSYFELGDFLIPALEVFDQNGLCAFISFGKDIATMTIVSVDDGSSVALTSPMAEAQLKGCHPIQNLGAVETYTRRYLWVAALEIVEHDALDSSKPLNETGHVKLAALSGAGDDLPEDEKTYLKEVAMYIRGLVVSGEVELAIKKYVEYRLDDSQTMYVDSLLDSKTRSAIRKQFTQKAA